MSSPQTARVVPLPDPRTDGEVALEATLYERHSVREYGQASIMLPELSQLLWAAQGNNRHGGRTAPSAGALYPIELYVVAGKVEGLAEGLYRYRIGTHALLGLNDASLQSALASAALDQDQVKDAAAVIVVAGVVERTAVKYGKRALRYVHMEVGAVIENVCLQVAALGLATVFVGAFDDGRVKRLLDLPADASPFALLPIGRPL
jgi:SagB-type dehydrogenase family enzyme